MNSANSIRPYDRIDRQLNACPSGTVWHHGQRGRSTVRRGATRERYNPTPSLNKPLRRLEASVANKGTLASSPPPRRLHVRHGTGPRRAQRPSRRTHQRRARRAVAAGSRGRAATAGGARRSVPTATPARAPAGTPRPAAQPPSPAQSAASPSAPPARERCRFAASEGAAAGMSEERARVAY